MIYVKRSQVTFETVLKPELGSTNRASSVLKLPIQNSLWQAVIGHAYHMARPAESPRPQQSVHIRQLGDLQYLSVWDSVLPCESQDGA